MNQPRILAVKDVSEMTNVVSTHCSIASAAIVVTANAIGSAGTKNGTAA